LRPMPFRKSMRSRPRPFPPPLLFPLVLQAMGLLPVPLTRRARARLAAATRRGLALLTNGVVSWTGPWFGILSGLSQ
jgi:hypothetical protein